MQHAAVNSEPGRPLLFLISLCSWYAIRLDRNRLEYWGCHCGGRLQGNILGLVYLFFVDVPAVSLTTARICNGAASIGLIIFRSRLFLAKWASELDPNGPA